MKKNILALLLLQLLMVVISACSKNGDTQIGNTNLTPINVKTYEDVTIPVSGTLKNKYTVSFGDTTIDLIKSSDSTLVFLVPNVPAGSYALSFELGKFNYSVTKTLEVNADSLVTKVFLNINNQVTTFSTDTSAAVTAQINKTKQYKQELTTIINKLSPSQKKEMALFYMANKEDVETFSSSVFTTFNSPTTFGTQSSCPRTNFKEFYGCTADNLSYSAKCFTKTAIKISGIIYLGYVSASLSPVSFGLGAVGSVFAASAAGYLIVTEALPAASKFGSAVVPFLEVNWIFTKAVFKTLDSIFTSGSSNSLGVTPEFRSVESTDNDVNTGTTLFYNSFATLSGYWNKLTSLFGKVPTYKANKKATTLNTSDITISGISNPNVELVSQSGQSATFKTLSGKDESFSYNIDVIKEGFEEKTTANATVKAKALTVGDTAYGGIVFYIDGTGQHGLVCATTDQSTSAVWDASSNATISNYNPTPTNATGTVIGTGSDNTTKIISVLGSNGAAASLCRNYRGGGFIDWFLPSKDELNELYKNRAMVGGLAAGYYWSSSEHVGSITTSAWGQTFASGLQDYYYNDPFYVRAVRAF